MLNKRWKERNIFLNRRIKNQIVFLQKIFQNKAFPRLWHLKFYKVAQVGHGVKCRQDLHLLTLLFPPGHAIKLSKNVLQNRNVKVWIFFYSCILKASIKHISIGKIEPGDKKFQRRAAKVKKTVELIQVDTTGSYFTNFIILTIVSISMIEHPLALNY